MMLNLQTLCEQYNIQPRGVIHIGAHEGNELSTYQEMGIKRILFIEANPVVFERLQTHVRGIPGVIPINCAISNQNGIATLYVTSMDQSSSILPLKTHKNIYPSIKEIKQIVVQTKKLDTLLDELQTLPSDFNIINIDIQGAELLAFQGATQLLDNIDAINTEVNFEELYEGCALIYQVDDFLGLHGFRRVATTTPYHPSWGDAFYVKNLVTKNIVTMSTLGKNGRFANQVFQYAFLKIYAKEHEVTVETPEWIGRYLFGHKDPPISQQLPIEKILLPADKTIKIFPDALITDNPLPLFKDRSLMNKDFWGYFQFNTKYYAPYKDYFFSLFIPIPEIKLRLDYAVDRLRSMGKTIVGLHLRRNDFGYSPFFIAPNIWYKEWLEGIWKSLDKPILFIATDEPDKVISDFQEYNPMLAKDLNIYLSEAEYYPDFYLLSQCDITAISNSSFSFAASMLNKNGKLFLRPTLLTKGLISFNPWNSEVLLYNDEIIMSIESNLHEGNLKYVIESCKTIMKTHPRDVIRIITMSINKSFQNNEFYDESCYVLATAFKEIGKLDDAMTFYQKVLEINPNHTEARNNFEITFREKERYREEVLCSFINDNVGPNTHNFRYPMEKFSKVYRENHQFIDESTFIVCAMFTEHKPKYMQYANRLINSCEKFKLPYILYVVPMIHKSISPIGQDDLTYTKSNFILFNMQRFPEKNILYVDIDVSFIEYPRIISEISASIYDFGIYNWLNDQHNEAYIPLSGSLMAGDIYSSFYRFSHHIDLYDTQQLICSGAVQFYKNSNSAKTLLKSWYNVIAENPDYADDESLDYTFNNFILGRMDFKPFWLDKSYCRYPWWIYSKPVIIHPDLPLAGSRANLTEINDLKRFYPEKCQRKPNTFIFPPDFIIDIKKRLLIKIVNDKIADVKPIKQQLWIYPEDFELI